jgi:hypothetical protein
MQLCSMSEPGSSWRMRGIRRIRRRSGPRSSTLHTTRFQFKRSRLWPAPAGPSSLTYLRELSMTNAYANAASGEKPDTRVSTQDQCATEYTLGRSNAYPWYHVRLPYSVGGSKNANEIPATKRLPCVWHRRRRRDGIQTHDTAGTITRT